VRPSPRILPLAAALCLLACDKPAQTGAKAPDAATSAAQTPDATAAPKLETRAIDLAALTKQAEALRGRAFQRQPAASPVAKEWLDVPPVAMDAPVARDAQILSEMLFGRREADLEDVTPARWRLARWDSASQTLLWAQHAPSQAGLERAIVAELVLALGQQAGAPDAPPPIMTLDAWVAQRAAAEGPVTFALALRALQAKHPTIDAATLAERPDLASALDVFPDEGISSSAIGRRAAHYAAREGFALTCSLYRAGGWSAVDLLARHVPPSTADVALPDRWLRGEGLAQWTWSPAWEEVLKQDGWQPQGQGVVGAFLISSLINGLARPEQTRGIAAVWRADTWRLDTHDKDGAWTWVSQWDSPTTATQVASIFEAAIKRRVGEREITPWRVRASGLDVHVLWLRGGRLPLLNMAPRTEGTRPAYPANTALPAQYVPSVVEQLVLGGPTQRLDEAGRWEDPQLGLKMEIGALEGWERQLNKRGPVRWYATLGEGVTQLSVEVGDPAAPADGGAAHQERVRKLFGQSIQGARFGQMEAVQGPLGVPWLAFSVKGAVQGKALELSIWQGSWRTLTLTLSIQAPAEDSAIPRITEQARAVWQSLATLP
jgi:hypothetical protein